MNDGPIFYMIVRRKPQRVYVFRILYAVNLYFHFLTRTLFFVKNNLTSSKTYFCLLATLNNKKL